MTEPGSVQEISYLLHETVFLIERRFGHSVERFLHRTKPLELVDDVGNLFHVNDSHSAGVAVRSTSPKPRAGSIVYWGKCERNAGHAQSGERAPRLDHRR